MSKIAPATWVPSDSDYQVLVKILQALSPGGGGGGTGGGVTSGTGAPTVAPAAGVGLYIQTDSVPPGQLWEYYSGAWH